MMLPLDLHIIEGNDITNAASAHNEKADLLGSTRFLVDWCCLFPRVLGILTIFH